MNCISVCISAPFLICWTYLLDKEFESNHQTFFVGRPGWLNIRLFTALTRNTCTFFIIYEKLEVLSELDNPVNVTNQTFIMKHRTVTPGWRVSRTSVAMCTCTRVGHNFNMQPKLVLHDDVIILDCHRDP